MEREERVFLSSNEKSNIHAVIWYPDSKEYECPLGVIQIAHGMIDHIERFEEMAEFFVKRGYVVAGNDHLGHGDSIDREDDYGYFGEDCYTPADYLVKDMYRLTKIMKKMYNNIPYIVIGHSMGSFIARKYSCIYGSRVDGFVFLGTGNPSDFKVSMGLKLAAVVGFIKGERYRSKLLDKVMFGTYNRRIKGKRTNSDWLTKDTKIVDDYISDPKCSYKFTVNGYKGLLNVIRYDIKETNIGKAPRDLPILLASGEEDPVGAYGKQVRQLYEKYEKYMDSVTLILYPDDRHELHSETNRQQVFEDILNWIKGNVVLRTTYYRNKTTF